MSEFGDAKVSVAPAVVTSTAELAAADKHTYGRILKSSALIGGSSVLNIGIGILRTKAMAVLLGPAGFGLLGLYGSIIDLAVSIAGTSITGSGALPSATIEGHYRFLVVGELPIDETDRVELRYTRGATFVGVLGGGLRRNLTDKLGLRIDARVLVGPGSTRPASRCLTSE